MNNLAYQISSRKMGQVIESRNVIVIEIQASTRIESTESNIIGYALSTDGNSLLPENTDISFA